MDDKTRNDIAESLERLADQTAWNNEVWQRCFDLVKANWDNELLAYVHDELIHYDGAFHSRNLLGFRVKPDRHELDQYREEFRDVASALRLSLSLEEAQRKCGF